MTEEEKKAISEQYKNGIVYVSSIIEPLIEQFKVDKGSIDIQQLQLVCDYLIKDRDYLETYIDDLDTEINKLNNVIDKLVEELRYEVGMGQDSIFCNNICNYYKENCKEEKCRKCIKEYFMKEDK